jgi:methyl coenzyme M reductase subunit C
MSTSSEYRQHAITFVHLGDASLPWPPHAHWDQGNALAQFDITPSVIITGRAVDFERLADMAQQAAKVARELEASR